MKSIAYTRYDHTQLTVSGSADARVLLVDSLDEAISLKQVSLLSGVFSFYGWWQRLKYMETIRRESQPNSVYWCRLNRSTGFVCVSDLCLTEDATYDVEKFLENTKSVKAVYSQLMCIGAALPKSSARTLLLLKNSIGVRHVYILAGKPVFVRLLPPSSSAEQLLDSLQSTWQHLLNRGLLEHPPSVLCQGISDETIRALDKAWSSSRVDSLLAVLTPHARTVTEVKRSIAQLAIEAYQARSWLKSWATFLPFYSVGGVARHRFRRLSICSTAVTGSLLIVLLAFSFLLKKDVWSSLLYLPGAIERVKNDVRSDHQKSLLYSDSPTATAQRLAQLDLLRSIQPLGSDILLSRLSDVFDAYPTVQLNHLSWFTTQSSTQSEASTEISSRDSLSMDATQPDHLAVMISGAITGDSLSGQQARFAKFKAALLSLEGVRDLVVEQTPVTQWRMLADSDSQTAPIVPDNFTLRFVLSDQSS